MTFGKQFLQALAAVALGALISTGAIGQVTTRLVVPGGVATTSKIVPGGTATFEVRVDAPADATIGTAYRLEQTAPATSSFFSLTGRVDVGDPPAVANPLYPYNDQNSGFPNTTVLAPASALFDPDNNDNLGRNATNLVAGIPAQSNILVSTISLTSVVATPLGTYRIQPVPGVSNVTGATPLFTDFDMSAALFDIVVGQTLSVTKTGTGLGTVTADSGLINCGATCSDIYPGTVVTLTATPNAGSTFTGWSGGGCVGTGTCVVTVNAATAVTAQFTVIAGPSPPTITKAFGAANIALNGTTSLTFTITNPNASPLTGVAFADSLPAGLVVSTPNGLTGSCGAGIITATAGNNAVSLGGGTLAASGNCTFSVNVTGTTSGVKNNTTSAVSSLEGGTGGTASATVTVAAGIAAPTITKSFAPTSIAVGGTSTLSFTITNPNASTAFTGVGFSDTFPAGVVISTPNGLTGSCGAGTFTAVAGNGNFILSGGTIPASGSCTFSVSVTGNTAGTKVNTTNAVTSVEGGTGLTATATLTVAAVAPPTISKVFGTGNIPANGTTTLSFTINNPNAATAVTGISFTDTFPAGLVVSTPNGLIGTCGAGTITAVAASNSVSLTGGTLAANSSCTFSVNVTATSLGTLVNTTGAVTSVEGGTGGTTTAVLTVGILAPIPTLSQWALLMLGLLMMIVTGVMLRSRRNG